MRESEVPAAQDESTRRAFAFLLAVLAIASLLLGLPGSVSGISAGPPQPTQIINPLNLAILWHMHQPLYKNTLTGLYEMPWVRDHTSEEYLDHPKILMQHPSVNVTFNLVPSLILQIEDYATGAIDNHIQLARIDLATATQDQRRMMAQEFIRLAPWHYTRNTTDGRIVNPWYDTYAAFPRLNYLVSKVSLDPLSLNNAELQDLETIFFLHQISVPYVEGQYDLAEMNNTILALLGKGTGYTQADTEAVIATERAIMARVVGFYKGAQDRGQAEVITTPFYHPIAPLLLDSVVPSEDATHNITKGSWANDTRYQYENATAFYAARFGRPPRGVWHSEQAVSPDVIPYAVDAGFNWTSSDEGVLWKSQVWNQTAGRYETVGQSLLNRTRVYNVTVAGRTMDIVFRDTDISNQVSFTYGGLPTDQAVADFMQRLLGFHDNLTDAQRADGLVTLAADGENWMFMAGYPNDGRDFLNRLYENLTLAQAAGWLRTWKIGDFLSQPGRVKVPLSTLRAGSWIDADFRTWSGEEEEQVGWARLTAARQAVVAFTQQTEGRSFVDPTSGPAVKRAWEAIFAAEGSDWFWWYGDDQSSGDDGKFDTMFKAHLITAYRTIGVTPPIDITAVWGGNATPTQPGNVTERSPPPTIDGTAGPKEWTNATGWTNTTSGDILQLRGFYAFADAASLYLRVDLNGNATALRGTTGRDVDVYLSNPIRTAERDMEVNLNRYGVNFATKNGGYLFNWAARYRLHVVFSQSLSTGVTPWSLFTAEEGPTYLGDGAWTYNSGKDNGVTVGSVIELLVPLSSLGLGPGDLVRLVVVTSNGTKDVDMLPSVLAGPGEVRVLVPSAGPPIAIFPDPIGDDVGDGDYTYPQSPDYRCSDGSHCESKLYDFTYFNISDAPTSVTFTVTFVDIGMNQWSGPNGFSYQIVNIYVDTDRVPGSGNLAMLTGPNAEVTPDFAWEAAIQAAGWSDARTFVTRDPAVSQRLQSGLLVRRVPGTMNVEITVPKALLPAGDPKNWGYVVVSGSQDGFGPGWWRNVAAIAGIWVCGGAGQSGIPPGYHSRIFDAITASGTSQTAALASYTASNVAKVPGVIVVVKAPGTPTVRVTPAAPWNKGQIVTLNWTATPNPDTLYPIQTYDVSVFYSATDNILNLQGTNRTQTAFTVSKELNITIRVTAYDGFATSAPFVGKYEVLRSPPPPPVNHAPVLTNGTLEPGQGDERTVFLFSVRYVDVNGNAPNVSLLMDGTPTSMVYIGGDNGTGAIFRLSLRLPAGDHVYKFRADDRQGTANSTVETQEFHLTVASGGVPAALVAGAGLGAAAVIAAATYLVWRSRRPRKTAPEESAEKSPEEPGTGKEGGV
ncbi:MAG: glucodextranase DOMON-like domain-containing protein [Thermoplasmata archaeon]